VTRVHLLALCCLLALSSASRWDDGPQSVSAAPLKAGEVELVYLANEGFLVRSRERAFVIDAFLKEPLGAYAALSPALHSKLAAGAAPFDAIDLALVSHSHADHFQAGSALAFMKSSPGTELATSPQVLAGLESRLGQDEAAQAVRARLHSRLPQTGQTVSFEHKGIEVSFLRLPHAGNRPTIQNLGHLIQFEDLTILHVGDAEGSLAVFAPYGLADVHIDVALLPYWFWQSAAGQDLVATELAAETLIAIHIPPREVAAVAESLSAADSGGVHVFRESLESLVIEAR